MRGGDGSVWVVAIVSRTVVSQYLDVLVAVLVFLLREIDGGIHLGTAAVEVGAQGTIVVIERASADGVYGLAVATVTNLDPRTGRAAMSHV